MKLLVGIFFIFIAAAVNGQAWRDSLNVARDAYKKQDYAKAMRYYESAQKNAPDNIDFSDEMGQSAYKAREFEKAEKIYQQSASTKKDKNAMAKTYHNMGNSRMKSKNYQGAIESYKEALRNNPNDDETRYNLSEAIRRLNDEQKKNNQNQNNQNQKDNQQNSKNNSQNQSNNNKDKQNQQQGQNGKNNKDRQNQQNSSPKSGKGGNDSNDKNQSKIPNKTVERMLDNLMKAEAATKRKMSGNGNENTSTNSGKDW